MSETTDPGQTPDATSTESLQLADQRPVAAAAPPVSAPNSGRSHTRTILEVVGGVVAVGLILLAGVVGFAVGHATGSDRDGHWSMDGSGSRGGHDRPDAGGPMGRQGQGFPGPGMMPGQDPRGIDPDGDNWTGGLPGQGPGQDQGQGFPGPGMMPGQPQPSAPSQG
jgi:hypothetical protein